MQFLRTDLAGCPAVSGMAVVIDVLRAFTTATYLVEAGVERIFLVSGVEEAFDLRARLPGSLILGEIDGIQVQGFDLGNSPTDLPRHDLRGKTIIQRTTAGTQGVIRAANAAPIYCAALTNAAATARCIRAFNPPEVTFILTGWFKGSAPDGSPFDWGDEDAACADLIEAYLTGSPPELASLKARVRASRSGMHYDGSRPAFPPSDLDYALQIDRFSFALRVEKRDGLHALQAVSC